MLRSRLALVLSCATLVLAVAGWAGPRAGLLMLVGLGYGLVLEGLRFGFAGPWRLVVTERDGRGLIAQLLAIGLTATATLPLLAAAPGELSGAHAPIGVAMVGAAFAFGAAMQLVMGCGSGTLINAGSGNLIGALALGPFIAGSFLGTLHLAWWASFGSLPILTLQGIFGTGGGLAVTLAGLAMVALGVAWCSAPGRRLPGPRLVLAALLLAGLATANLMIAGQAWGIVYGLGLWGAKLVQAGGADLSPHAYWGTAANLDRLASSVLLDVTSLTNIGLMVGAFVVMRWRAPVADQVTRLRPLGYASVLLAGLVLGYSARVAFGCNVGAYFSGISTGSLHGWAWFAAAFLGSGLGLRLRLLLLRPAAQPAVPAGAT